jgi:hypothetical protein
MKKAEGLGPRRFFSHLALLLLIVSLSRTITVQSVSDSAHLQAVYPSKLELVLPHEEDLQMSGASCGNDAKASLLITVRSNIDWLLQVKGYYGGKMQKVTDTGVLLKNQMRVLYTEAGPSSEVILTNNYKNYRRGPPGEYQIPTDLKQNFAWDDQPTNYTMRVSFKVSPD